MTAPPNPHPLALLPLLLIAAGPAWGQAAGSAGNPAAPVTAMETLMLKIDRHDPSGHGAFAEVGITPELPAGTECDAVSGADGEARCRIPCDPADTLSKLFRAVTERRDDYDRTPARITARLVGCRLDPKSLTVTYKHVRVRKEETRTALGALIGGEPALPAGILEAEPPSAEVGAALAAISGQPEKAAIVGRFQRLTSDLASLALRTGERGPAAQYSAYATAAANVMLADIARRYSPEGDKDLATSGEIGIFIDNAGKLSVLAEGTLGSASVPLDLQVETAAKLADVNQKGQLDGAAQADVYKLWYAHQPFAPAM